MCVLDCYQLNGINLFPCTKIIRERKIHQNKKHRKITSKKVVPKGSHSLINKVYNVWSLDCTYKQVTNISKTNSELGSGKTSQVHIITIKIYQGISL
jgi:hypothetical protein